MIRIRKQADPPAVLVTRGPAAIGKRDADGKLVFNKEIYRHNEVKTALIASHRGKCCFCEQIVQEDGDVEHFRPKSHYYWLAYDWANLLWACSPCNSRHKRSLFPLRDESCRATSPYDTDLEEPLFINPTEEDPEDLIEWRSEFPVPRPGPDSAKAKETLRALRLDKRGLLETRRQRLSELEAQMDSFKIALDRGYSDLVPLIAEALVSFQREDRPFTAMMRWRLRQRPDVLARLTILQRR